MQSLLFIDLCIDKTKHLKPLKHDNYWCISSKINYYQLLDECHCWWTSESPRAHVAKLYGRLRLIRGVLRASTFWFKIVIFWDYYTIPLNFSLFWHFWGINLLLLKLVCLAKDYWGGFSTRIAHMVHIVVKSDLKWCIHLSRSLLSYKICIQIVWFDDNATSAKWYICVACDS